MMRQIAASGELAHLTPERVWKELEKVLSGDTPQIFFQVLRDCGALAALFPELDTLFGIQLVRSGTRNRHRHSCADGHQTGSAPEHRATGAFCDCLP